MRSEIKTDDWNEVAGTDLGLSPAEACASCLCFKQFVILQFTLASRIFHMFSRSAILDLNLCHNLYIDL